MIEFLSSSTFMLSAIGLMVVSVVIALLWRNTVWEARGITPADDVERLKGRLAGLIPKSIVAWCVVTGVVILVIAGLWWGVSSSTPPPDVLSAPDTGRSWSPTPNGVWEFTKDYWFWSIIGLALLFFGFGAVGKTWAKAAQGMVVTVVVVLVGAIIVHGIWGEKLPSQQAQQQLERPVVTMPANGNSVHVDQKIGYILIFTGSGFEHHVVYTGGRDCLVGNTKDPCQEGPILYQYVRDTTGKPNSATYRFVL
ncbi:MAG: hypothetical protein AAB517_03065 [Patescibacteria group bacterium]